MSGESAAAFGEFALIERLRSRLGAEESGAEVVVGNGDDAAVIEAGGGKCWAMTCDVQAQGVHFPMSESASGFDAGWKALAANASDIAAMGGRPRFALVSLGVPGDAAVSFLDGAYDGLRALSERCGVLVLGGNVARTEGPLFIDVFLVGEVMRKNVLRRSGARPGDRLLVTGRLGDAAAGLDLLARPQVRIAQGARERLVSAQSRPLPRAAEGAAVAESGLATSMMDVSDGLAGDVRHLCGASGAGAVLWEERLPVSDALREWASAAGENPLEWALRGGEDYELLVTAPEGSVRALQEIVSEAGGAPLTPIGEIAPLSEGISVRRAEGISPLESLSWDHFPA